MNRSVQRPHDGEENGKTNTSTSTSSTTVSIVNPYAHRRAPPPLSTKPLHDEDYLGAFVDAEADRKVAPLAPLRSSSVSGAPTEADRQREEESTSSPSGNSIEGIAARPTIPQMPLAQGKTAASYAKSTNVPLWKRLPSQNLSFGSAEILTVAECYQHCRQYCDQQVRATGVLLHRYVHEDSRVSMLLGDPLSGNDRKTVQNGRPRQHSLGGISIVAQRQRRVSSGLVSETPGTTSRLRHTVVRKTPGTVFKTPQLRTSTLITPGLTTGRKRPLSNAGANDMPPMRVFANALQTQANCIHVLADPSYVSVNHSVEGDLLMVIGKLGKVDDDIDSGSTHDSTAMAPSTSLSQLVQLTQQQQQQQQEQQPPYPQAATDRPQAYFIKARILRNANGTNMKLHTDALMCRRRQILAMSSNNGDEEEEVESSLRQGCGPPPYDKQEKGGC